jgi:biopolymer transport protein ExbD
MRNTTSMNAEINVTPFLDVLLVLLILFMYLCLNQQKVITAQLPDPNVDAVTENTPPIFLEVRPSATYALNTQVVQPGQLDAQLRRIYAGRKDKTIIVRAVPGVRYQEVVTAIDVAKGAGVVAVGLDGGKLAHR